MRRQWHLQMSNPNLAGARVRSYILPIFDEWMDRKQGGLTFHLTQLITEHGSFGVFLERIKKERSAICPYCRVCEDNAQHTLNTCPKWDDERKILKAQIGNNLEISAVIRNITRDPKKWERICSFANKVLTKKETDEWERQKRRRKAEYFEISKSSTDQTDWTPDS